MDATPSPAVTPPPAAAGEDHRVTPLMEQYIEIKAANPDCLLFYRMGDFYELFFGDAEVASRALGIVLTKRGKHRGQDIPMCGVPTERADEYLHRLIALGHRVAVCEQLEDPAEARKRGGKSIVRRDVVRLVTPGTLTEDSLLDARRNNYLVAIARAKPPAAGASRYALAFLDISTGEFRLAECDRTSLPAELARLEPGEIIVSDALYGDGEVAPLLRTLPVTPLGRDVFDGATAERPLDTYFAVATTDAFGTLTRLELTAAAACITYVERTQIGKRPPLSPPTREAAGATLAIDAATRANLELMRTQTGERRGSLIGADARRPRGDRAPARRGRAVCGRCAAARRCPRAPRRGARSRPRAGAAGGGARRPARSRRDPRRPRRRGGTAPAARHDAGRRGDRRCDGGVAAARSGDRGAACRSARRGAAPLQARRRLRRAAIRRGPRRDPCVARRIPAGRGSAAGALRRRYPGQVAQDPAQQRARIFRRGHR